MNIERFLFNHNKMKLNKKKIKKKNNNNNKYIQQKFVKKKKRHEDALTLCEIGQRKIKIILCAQNDFDYLKFIVGEFLSSNQVLFNKTLLLISLIF